MMRLANQAKTGRTRSASATLAAPVYAAYASNAPTTRIPAQYFAMASARLELRDARLPQEEAPAVGGALLELVARGAHAVTAVVLEAHQHGLAAAGGGGEARSRLERHPHVHARVVHAVLEEHRGVRGLFLDVRVRAHRQQRAELLLDLHRAVLGNVADAVGARLRADRVGVAHADRGGCEEVGTLGDRAAHEDPAGASAVYRKPSLRGIAVRDQPLARGDAVLPGVRFRAFPAGAAPGIAVDAAAANVRDRQHAAALE